MSPVWTWGAWSCAWHPDLQVGPPGEPLQLSHAWRPERVMGLGKGSASVNPSTAVPIGSRLPQVRPHLSRTESHTSRFGQGFGFVWAGSEV